MGKAFHVTKSLLNIKYIHNYEMLIKLINMCGFVDSFKQLVYKLDLILFLNLHIKFSNFKLLERKFHV